MSDLLDAVLDTTTTDANAPADLMDDFVSSLTTEEAPPATTEEPPKTDDPPPTEEAPKTDEPPKTDQPPADDAEPDEFPKNPRAKDWEQIRESRNRWKTTADELTTSLSAKEQALQAKEAELAELRAKAARLPELEEKLKDLDSYEKELSVTRIEATREYKETIAKPLQILGQTAETLAKSNDTDPDKVYEMMREVDPAVQRSVFKEITTGWDEVDRGELWSAVKDAREILDKQDKMREHASAAAKEQQELAAKRVQAEKEAFQKEFTTSLKDVAKSLREKTPFIPLAEGETEDDRYTTLEQKVAAVDFDAQSPRGKAFAAATAILYPQMVKTIQKLQEEVGTLKSRVKDSNSSKASVSPSEKTTTAAEESQDFLAAMGVPKSPMLSHSLNVVGV